MQINAAIRGLVISFEGLGENQYGESLESLVGTYALVCKPAIQKIPFTFIGEHEFTHSTCRELSLAVSTNSRSLGLYENQYGNEHEELVGGTTYGLKLKEHIPLKATQAWGILQEKAPLFCNAFCPSTTPINIKQYLHDTLFIPVYLNHQSKLLPFLCFLSNHLIEETPKNMVIHLSGFKIESQDAYDNLWKKGDLPYQLEKGYYHPNFKITEIKSMDENNQQHAITFKCLTFDVNITLLSGFYLDDTAYDAFYQLAKVALVSGDNSLEQCISMNVLPFYWSSNHSENKWRTVRALQRITQDPKLDLTQEARDLFHAFFNISRREAVINTPFWYEKLDENPLAFPKMIKAWHLVTEYLRENKNFYNQLENIVLETMSAEARLHLLSVDVEAHKLKDLEHCFGQYPMLHTSQPKPEVVNQPPVHVSTAPMTPVIDALTQEEKALQLQFEQAKDNLFLAIQEMRDYGYVLRVKGASEGLEVMFLSSDLRQLADNFFIQKDADFLTFKQDFSVLLVSKNNEMERYQTWGTMTKNVAIALTGVGTICIAIQLMHSKVTTGRASFFFQKKKATFKEKIEKIQEALDNLDSKKSPKK
jgi:hypothetical protein